METETKTYYGAVDYVKAIAIVAVIITHAGLRGSDPNISAFEKVLRQSWVGFQVPAFFLVAGFLYHKSQKLPWSEIGRRLIRIIIPYLVASSVALLIGFGRPLSADKILFDLATGNVVGIYYFVFVLCLCIPFSWLYSRLPRPALWMILMLLVGYSALIAFGYLSRPSTTFFWSVRGLFFTFFLGYFTTG
ncbi:MAG: acyltransferase family protein, partial [Myxococcota bacterium]|nr:acyltransferase family protein [Myxococcota bacterium]